jgi:hypothetical protein
VATVNGLWLSYGSEGMVFIQGGARGADSIAKRYADRLAEAHANVTSLTFPAKWYEHDREGLTRVPCRCDPSLEMCRAAGPRRNRQMLDEGRPQAVYAFHDHLENSKGTRDMVTAADEAGVPVYVVSRWRQSVRPRTDT